MMSLLIEQSVHLIGRSFHSLFAKWTKRFLRIKHSFVCLFGESNSVFADRHETRVAGLAQVRRTSLHRQGLFKYNAVQCSTMAAQLL